MKALILLPDRDRDPGDWHGAFRPEAEHLVAVHQLPAAALVQIDIDQDEGGRRAQVLRAIEQSPGLDLLAVLCHGWKGGLQLGFHLHDVPVLASALATSMAPGCKVVLYACWDGDGAGANGDGGFADQLRDCLSRCVVPAGPWSGWIDAHSGKGHCTSNADVRRFPAGEAEGGAWLVAPGSPLWPAWEREVHDRHGSTLRLRYPLLSQEAVHDELLRRYG